ncbi:EF-hand [Meredithblackwellia eburnea MCA 4105]
MSNISLGRPSTGKGSTKHPRVSSQAAYSVFEPSQIQTFKEAFSLIDADNDGLISENDLKNVFSSLGQPAPPQLIRNLLESKPRGGDPSLLSPNQFNFTTFLTLMAEHLSLFDPETDLLTAFSTLDSSHDSGGFIPLADLRRDLATFGTADERMSDDEIDRFLSGPFLNRQGDCFDYRKFCQTLRVTDYEEDGDGEGGVPGEEGSRGHGRG